MAEWKFTNDKDIEEMVKDLGPFVPYVIRDEGRKEIEFCLSPEPFHAVWTGKGTTLFIGETSGTVIGGIIHNLDKYEAAGDGKEEDQHKSKG